MKTTIMTALSVIAGTVIAIGGQAVLMLCRWRADGRRRGIKTYNLAGRGAAAHR